MENHTIADPSFEEQCVIDDSKIFYYDSRVFRAVYSVESATLYRNILDQGFLDGAFDRGLVRTKIANISLKDSPLVLEHEAIDFFLHPQEMTDRMFWKSALAMIGICIELARKELLLKDAHCWNMTFHKGRPVFFDFGSIVSGRRYSNSWVEEFYKYFAVPVWLAHSRWNRLAVDYRRQHLHGFGLSLSKFPLIRRIIFRSFWSVAKRRDNTLSFLENLYRWIERLEPKKTRGYWDSYEQAHNNSFENPRTIKQRFVFDILKEQRPAKVVDLATNKGFYALMAERFGASVIGFDYEPFSVDEATKLSDGKNITFCQMDFTTPTPPYGWGLTGPGAFDRFQSDIALALGLIHHVCLVQKFPVKLFCDVCAKFSKNGVILEFVYPEDSHVMGWRTAIPKDYSKESLKGYFSRFFKSFKESEILQENNLKRQFLFFYERG